MIQTTMPRPIGQPAEQKTVRLLSGRVVPAATMGRVTPKPKKFLIVIQHYEGDVEAAEQLASLIADLERTRNHEADIMLMNRADSRQMATGVIAKLEAKFDRVLLHTCRRTDGKGHPWGCNSMFYDLVSLMQSTRPYSEEFFAFINLESDCCPTRPGWIGELIAEWKKANAEGWSVIGQEQHTPNHHFNGVAVYAPDIYSKVGSKILSGGSPQVAYDVRHGPSILPFARDTGLIYFKFRQRTITPEELFEVKRGGVEPALYHGVKDGSARTAVRNRHINMSAPAVKRQNVYTYFVPSGLNASEEKAIVELWRQGWSSRGWNPVVLKFGDVAKHKLYPEFEAALDKLPCATDREKRDADFYRWLALDSAGGGLLVEVDALPKSLTPEMVKGIGSAVVGSDGYGRTGAIMLAPACRLFIDYVLKNDAQPDDVLEGVPHVSDETVMTRLQFPNLIQSPEVVRFTSERVAGERKSAVMAEFLRGE